MFKKKLLQLHQKKRLILFLLSLFMVSFSFAQQVIIVKGTILSEKNIPLAGVTVLVKGSTSMATTNEKGMYLIKASKGATLIYSLVGYEEKQIKIITENSGGNVILVAKNADLSEVVVVGYGTSRKSDLTGSVASISKEKIQMVPTATFDLKLQGRVSGVSVTSTSGEPGGNVSVRIRGSNSISGDNEPLYVVDGYPISAGGEATGNGYGQPQNALSGINPNDIESIQVLKDASATAIYGSRGANGVILITTKRGAARPIKVELNTRVGTTNVVNIYDMMIARDYAQIRNDFAVSQGLPILYDGSSVRLPTPAQAGVGTNWVKEILQPGVSQNYQLNVSGGSEGVKYDISGNYFKESGVVKNSNLIRGNLRANIDNKISEKLTINTTINLSNTISQRVQAGTGALLQVADPINNANRSSPIFPVNATATGEFGGILNTEEGGIFNNPVTVINDKKDQTKNEDYFASLLGVYKITKDLGLNVRAGTTVRNSTRQIYFPTTTGQGFLTKGDAYSNTYSYNDYVFESFLKYQKALNENNKIDLTGGFSFQSNTSVSSNVRVTSFPNDLVGFDALQFGTAYYPTTSQKILRTLQSFYARANYNLLNRYLFTFTGRADGSSVFAENNKWGFFPSGAVAWKVSEEPFFNKSGIINDFKVRGSYGIVGNQAISPLGSLSRLGVANYTLNDVTISGIAPINLSNPNLKWETTKAIDLGVDLAFFKGKLNLVVDVYQKTTSDLLQQLQLPFSSGYTSAINNVGSIENKGLEIDLSGTVMHKKDFDWTVGFNVSLNRSKILALGVVKEILGPGPGTNYLSSPSNVMRVGEQYAMFYGLKALRLIQPTDLSSTGAATFATFNGEKRPGQWLYEDLNKDGIINLADRQIIGNPNPDFIFGFTNDFKYKNFGLSIFIQGVSGNDVMNLNTAYIRTGFSISNKTQKWYENRWTPTNPTNDIRYPAFGTAQASLVSGNYYLEDASYVRLKNVTLSYNFPKLGKSISSASMFISGTNLITITKYSGFDPEIGIYGQNNQIPGIDFGGYPRSRILDFGFKFIF